MRVALATGRLEQPGWRWLNAQGLVSGSRVGRSLLWAARPSLEVAIVRGRDIPELLRAGAVDVGIVGRDVLEESGLPLSYGENLGFGLCRLMFAGPEGFDPARAEKIRIATKYPGITRRWATEKGYRVEISSLQGSVEVAPALGLADAVVDVVETGSTLRANGLFPQELVLESYATVVTRIGEENLLDALGSIAGADDGRDGMGRAAQNA